MMWKLLCMAGGFGWLFLAGQVLSGYILHPWIVCFLGINMALTCFKWAVEE